MISKLKAILKEETILKYILSGAAILFIVCVLEFTVFNYRHWQSLKNDPIPVTYTLSDNLAIADVNAFEVMSDSGENYIEVTGLDVPIHNIMADFTFPLVGVYAVQRINYHFQIIDEGNSIAYTTPQYTFMHLVPQSYYNYLDTYGNLKSFRIYFDNLNAGEIVRVEFLVLNSIVPMMFSKKRVLALTFFIFMLFMLRPKSILYRIPASKKTKIKTVSIVAVLLLEIAFSNWAIHLNAAFQDPQDDASRQFMLMAEALAQGETHLLVDPPQALNEFADPYDYEGRMQACIEAGDALPLSDVAYRDGKYFVYFGVAPIILYYLPYYLITGTHVKTVTVVLINMILAFMGITALLYEIMRRYYKEMPLAVFLMFNVMFSFGSGLVFLLLKPDFYAVPLSMALALCMWGLYFWLYSITADKIIPWAIAIGSFLLALESATRPQFLLASFLAILMFWNVVFKDRKLFSKDSIGATVAFVLPYVIVAAAVMYYNYDRFGSPFDFGANYNLTYNNMTYRGFHLDRLWYGSIGYMFFPCTVSNTFPYFDMAAYTSTYAGVTSDEALFGGLIYNNLILIPVVFGFKFRKVIGDVRKFIFVIIAPFIAMFISFVDGNMAGMLTRYFNDSAWYVYIAGFIILGSSIMYLVKEREGSAVKMVGMKATPGTEASVELPSASDENIGKISQIGPDWVLNVVYTLVWVCFAIFIVRIFLAQFAGNGHPQENLILTWQNVKHLVEFWH